MLLTCMNKEKKVREITFLPFLSLVSAVSGSRGTRGEQEGKKLWRKVILFISPSDKVRKEKEIFCAQKPFFKDK